MDYRVQQALAISEDIENEIGFKAHKLFVVALMAILAELGRDVTKWGHNSDIVARVSNKIEDLRLGLNNLSVDMESTAIASGISRGGVLQLTTFTQVDPIVLRNLQDYRAFLIKGFTDEMNTKLTGIIKRAFLSGKGVEETAREVSSAFDKLSQRAVNTVRMEFARIVNMATQAKMNEIGLSNPNLNKMWITAMINSRDAHIRAHGQVVPYNQPYHVGGELLMYPLDPAGSAANVINCRCISVPVRR